MSSSRPATVRAGRAGNDEVDWHLRDPMHQPLGEVRQIRDEVR
jgi:hypothetical protein